MTFFVDKAGLVQETKLGWGKDSLTEFKVLVAELVSR